MTILGVIILASLIFTNCGGGKTESILKLKTISIQGGLSEYFVVVDGTYKLIQESEEPDYDGKLDFKIKILIKRTDKKFDFDKSRMGSGHSFISCDLLDEAGVPVVTADGGDKGVYATQGVNTENEAIMSLKSGETCWAIFPYSVKKDEISKVKMMQVRSYLSDYVKNHEYLMAEDNNSTSSDVDCDKFIKDYSAFVDSYIKLLKKYKANPTDASILSEYTDAVEKATEMETNAGECDDPKYASKLMELSNKIAKALQ